MTKYKPGIPKKGQKIVEVICCEYEINSGHLVHILQIIADEESEDLGTTNDKHYYNKEFILKSAITGVLYYWRGDNENWLLDINNTSGQVLSLCFDLEEEVIKAYNSITIWLLNYPK